MKLVVNPEYSNLEEYLRRIPEQFESRGQTLYAGRNTVKLIECQGLPLVVKRFKRPNIFQKVAYTWFQPSKAERAFRYGQELLARGFDTPEPLAYIEIRRGGMLAGYYFISRHTSDLPLFPALVQTEAFDTSLACAVGRYLARMHEAGVLHGDPNLSNILYRRSDSGEPQFSVIDTNRSRFFPTAPGRDLCLANLVRVTHRRDLLRVILGAYSEARGWDPVATEGAVSARLDRFERTHDRKDRLKRSLRRLRTRLHSK